MNPSRTPPQWVILWTGLAALIVFIYMIRSVLPPFLIGAAGAYIFSPVAATIQRRWKLPRWAATALLCVAVLGPVIVAGVVFGPRLVGETRLLVVRGPTIIAGLIENVLGPGPYTAFGPSTDSQQVAAALIAAISGTIDTPSNALHIVSGVMEGVLSTFLSLIVSVYLLVDAGRVENLILNLVSRERRREVRNVNSEIHQTLARYLRRQLILVVLVGSVTYLGLRFIFHLRYALPLAITTGVVEIIPFIGPVFAGSIASTIALSQSGTNLTLGIIIFYVIVRQVEDQIVAPVVLGRAVELHPLIVIFSVFVGGALFGVLGTLAAIPVAASAKVFLDYWPKLTAPPPEIVTVPVDPPTFS